AESNGKRRRIGALGCVGRYTVTVDLCRGQGEDALAQGTAQAAKGEVGRLAKAYDNGTARPLRVVEHDRIGAEWTRVEAQRTPLRQPALERPVELRLSTGEGVAVIVSD